MGNDLAEAGMIILNPRDIHIRSLAGADAIWMRDQSRYAQEKKYQKDLKKRPPELY